MDHRPTDEGDTAQRGLFEPPSAPEDLAARALAAGWPDGLIDRAVRLRFGREVIEAWLESGFPPADALDKWFGSRERLVGGTLRARQATWEDSEAVTDLFAHAPERVGPWQVTVERGPNPYAQLRLQEHAYLQVLEDRGVLLGAFASSSRASIVGGEEITVGVLSSWRIRDGFRGQGYSEMVRSTPGPGTARFPMLSYWYVRSDNAAAVGWIANLVDEWNDRPAQWSIDVEGLHATVHHLRGPGAGDPRVRPTGRADLGRCVELINATHDGLDLFRPYDQRFLRDRLEDGSWGPQPAFIAETYSWADHAVLEEDGVVIACAGLWDQGRDIRERWVHAESGEERTVDHGAVLDFGFAPGREDAMIALLGHLQDQNHRRNRTSLVVPLEFLPEVAAGLETHPEQRAMQVMPFTSPELTIDLRVERPYTDLVYW